MPKRRVVDHVQDGEVLLVDKQAVMPDKVVELTHHQAEKLRPRAQRTPAQIENTKRLVELNRKRANEWKSRLSSQAPPPAAAPVPQIEDDSKVAVRVKPKRAYNRKAPMWNSAEMDKPAPPPPPPARPAAKKKQPVAYYSSSEEEESDEDEEEDVPQPLPPPKPKVQRKRLVKSGKRVASDTTSESETTDTDVELHRVQKYVKKTAARMDAVKAIDERIKQVSNKYVAAGLSVF
jgi:hypothetical protein